MKKAKTPNAVATSRSSGKEAFRSRPNASAEVKRAQDNGFVCVCVTHAHL